MLSIAKAAKAAQAKLSDDTATQMDRERKRQDAERSQLAVQVYKQCDALHAKIDETESGARSALEAKSLSLVHSIGSVEQIAKRTITKAERTEEAVEAC